MVHTLIGDIGHLLVIVSLVTAVLSSISFGLANANAEAHTSWNPLAKSLFYIHFLAVIGVVITLFLIIYNQYYEYHYAWEHSSRSLATHYMISCFWEGQEGSFLLWIFWNGCLGVILILTNKYWQNSLMTIFCAVQAFLASMILGVIVGDLKIGSSPFILLRDYMIDAPVFKMNPNYVPADGTGLNPLLQNYWMVIHPPTLFLGFALTLVPFAYCLAGLWKKNMVEWIRPALPWSLVGATILGIGILMGGYWAYETLNFGGYWNWDPVENAVYVPWLVLVAAIHTMLVYKNSSTGLKTTIILTLSVFILILYSTFLTRSGILGNASVHSFTDLGMSGQLLVYLLFFVAWSVYLAVKQWKLIPGDPYEPSVYSREFWIFIGTLALVLAAFQVIVMTSIPVYNNILSQLNITARWAPPADAMDFYGKWQLWFSVVIALLSGFAQFFYWQKLDASELKKVMYWPIILTLVLVSVIITVGSVNQVGYMVLVLCSVYTVVSNSFILAQLVKSNVKLAGGAVSHIGLGIMLVGILFSAGYSKVVSLNTSGLLYSKEFSEDMNRENILLFVNEPQRMGAYTISFLGSRVEAKNIPGYVDINQLEFTQDPAKAIALEPIVQKGRTFVKAGDTVHVYPENTYYEVVFDDSTSTPTHLFPRAQVNPQMGLIASPDILKAPLYDLYTHVSSIPDPEKDKKWSEREEFTVAMGDTFFVNDYVAKLESVEKITQIPGVELGGEDVAVKAKVRVLAENKSYFLYPIFVIKNKMVGIIPDTKTEIGLRLGLAQIDPVNQRFTFYTSTAQKDWIILKSVKKPLINLLWIGSIIVIIGFFMAIIRRFGDFQAMKLKGEEVREYSNS